MKKIFFLITLLLSTTSWSLSVAQPSDNDMINTYMDQMEEDVDLPPEDFPIEFRDDIADSRFIDQLNLPNDASPDFRDLNTQPSPWTNTPLLTGASTQMSDRNLASIKIDSLELRDMDIRDVLKLISRKTDLNIVAGKDIQGKVTVYLRDINVYEALRIILDSNNLAFINDNNVIRVMTAQEYQNFYGRKFGQNLNTAVVKLRGLKASNAVGLLERMKSSVGKVIADDNSNTIMIEDLPETINHMKNFLTQIDQPLNSYTFLLHYVQAENILPKVENLLTPGIGTVKFDERSNKLFVKDTSEVLKEVDLFLREVDVSRTTQVFDLSYAKAETIATTLEKVLTPGIGQVEFDERSNKLIVMDTLAKLNEIAEMIIMLDHSEQEVLIDARIVQVTLTDDFQLGIDWQAIIPNAHNFKIDNAFGNVAGDPEVSRLATFQIGTLSDDNYQAVLEALKQRGKISVLSNPRVAVINNEEAKILVGSTKPYVTSSTTTTNGTATTAETINFIDVGVKLFVTPQIHNDGFITMKVKPEVSSAANDLETSQGNFIPIVETSEAETIVRVKNGVTIVIGGLIKEEGTETKTEVPLLGSIPLIGRAFSHEKNSSEKTEIVIFLTPRIISGDINTTKSLSTQ